VMRWIAGSHGYPRVLALAHHGSTSSMISLYITITSGF